MKEYFFIVYNIKVICYIGRRVFKEWNAIEWDRKVEGVKKLEEIIKDDMF